MRILHIAPFNTAGVPYAFVKAEKALGYESRLITFAKHRYDFDEDICLHLPFIDSPGLLTLKKLLRSSSITEDSDKTNLPPVRKYNALEKPFLKFRDILWSKKVNNLQKTFDIYAFDLYQLDGGKGFFNDARIIKKLSEQGKTIICTYLGSDLRRRGVFSEISRISLCDFTVEYDNIDLYPGIHHIPFPFDFSDFPFSADVIKTPVIVGHAPSSRFNKGTDTILKVLKKLQQSFSFNIQLIENKPHNEALFLKSQCSLFIDQISSLGYGINAVESLAMGIPTFSSLMPHFKEKYPDHPIIEITENNLEEKLIPFIESGDMRLEKGKTSREWAKEVHEAKNVVKDMHSILCDRVHSIRNKIVL